MTDIHAHILPGIDDGAESIEDSAAMASLALESGVCSVIATPHCDIPGDDRADPSLLRRGVRNLQTELAAKGIPLKVYAGMEIFGTPYTAERLKNGLLMTLADSRYPLIEFPLKDYGTEATRILDSVLKSGFTPIVAHPERYRYVQNEPKLLNLWTDMGCIMQMNRGSVLGRFGARTQALAEGMLERGFVGLIASDAHSSSARTTWMRDVWELLCRARSTEYAELLLRERPESIIEDKRIDIDDPEWF